MLFAAFASPCPGLKLDKPIDWQNYYDYGDPVGFDLDTTRARFTEGPWREIFNFTAEDNGLREDPIPPDLWLAGPLELLPEILGAGAIPLCLGRLLLTGRKELMTRRPIGGTPPKKRVKEFPSPTAVNETPRLGDRKRQQQDDERTGTPAPFLLPPWPCPILAQLCKRPLCPTSISFNSMTRMISCLTR